MSFFRKANKTAVVRWNYFEKDDDGNEIGEPEGWVEARKELTKGEVNQILRQMRAPKMDEYGNAVADMNTGIDLMQTMFTLVVVRWDAQDEDGNDIAVTLDNYLALEGKAARFIDEKLTEYLNDLMGRKTDEDEGKPQESPQT